jgi:hypothetical protein
MFKINGKTQPIAISTGHIFRDNYFLGAILWPFTLLHLTEFANEHAIGRIIKNKFD